MGETRTETGPKPGTETGGPKPGPKPGQPQLTPWAAGIFPGLHYTTAGNIPLMLARGVSPGWTHPGPFLSALGRSQRPSGAWGGAKIGRAHGRSPHPNSSTRRNESRQFEISNSHSIKKIALP